MKGGEMNYAVLLSGGSGSRAGSDIPKQYVKAGRHMMIIHALRTLVSSVYIDRVIIAASPEWERDILEDAGSAGVELSVIAGFASPGKNRQLSIRNSLEEIEPLSEPGGEDTVFIHDAARPFLSGKQIRECFEALPGHDGVMPVLPMKDTVYQSTDGKRIAGLMDRSSLYRGQAPELFLYNKYLSAVRTLSGEELLRINGSSEPAVMAGMDIAMIPGDERNFKVTTKEDLERYMRIIKTEETGS